jgi:hypothetical protein
MPLFRRLATLATAAEAARRYAKKNPEKTGKYLDQAAAFVDKQTKGKYSGQISGATQKAKNVAGIRQMPGHGAAGNGYSPGHTQGYDQNAGFGKTAGYTGPESTPKPAPKPSPQAQPGEPYPGSPER